jgi:hypothetical protein
VYSKVLSAADEAASIDNSWNSCWNSRGIPWELPPTAAIPQTDRVEFKIVLRKSMQAPSAVSYTELCNYKDNYNNLISTIVFTYRVSALYSTNVIQLVFLKLKISIN